MKNLVIQAGLEKVIGLDLIRKNIPQFYKGTVEINGVKVVYSLCDNYDDCLIYELGNEEAGFDEYPEYEEDK